MKFKPDTYINHLKPAGFYFLEEPGVIRTVLGSCVTVTMYCPRTGMGSACHPVLPSCRDNRVCHFAGCRDKYKYVECVVPEMVKRFRKTSVNPGELEVKIFGGSELIPGNGNGSQVIQVGRMNTEKALEKIKGFGMEVKSYDIGGHHGRRLFFDTSSGDVWVKRLNRNTASIFEQRDMQKQIHLQQKG